MRYPPGRPVSVPQRSDDPGADGLVQDESAAQSPEF